MKIVYISDFFYKDGVIGGSELNDHELLSLLREEGHQIEEARTSDVSLHFLEDKIEEKFIVSNFVNLDDNSKKYMEKFIDYVIYEHDHKYTKDRDPSVFKKFQCPVETLVNISFYENSLAVFCQSNLHSDILKRNVGGEVNVINLSGNLWSLDELGSMREYSKNKKNNRYSVLDSQNPIKNTKVCVEYCKSKGLDYELIPKLPRKEFLKKLSENNGLVFFPDSIETLNRVCVEARMMNCKIITNKKTGATSEKWFSLKGEELIEEVLKMRSRIQQAVIGALN